MNKTIYVLITMMLVMYLSGCSSTKKINYVESERVTLIDIAFNDTDRRKIVDESMQSMLKDKDILSSPTRPVILIGKKFIKNKTTEHISIDALLDLFSDGMVGTDKLDVVNLDMRPDLHEEYNYHASGYIDPATIKGPGKEAGAQFVLSSVITSKTHKNENTTVLAYQASFRLTDLSTHMIKWSNITNIKKVKE